MGEPSLSANYGRDDAGPDKFEALIVGSEHEIATVAGRFDLDVGCRHAHLERRGDGSVVMVAIASEDQIEALRAAGYAVQKGENLSARGRSLQHEIGTGDRFEGGRIVPRGFGGKGGHIRPGQDS